MGWWSRQPGRLLETSLSRPLAPADRERPWHGSRGLGSLSDLAGEREWGWVGCWSGSILVLVFTPCLVSRPRGAVLHVNGRAKRCSGRWGCLQSD